MLTFDQLRVILEDRNAGLDHKMLDATHGAVLKAGTVGKNPRDAKHRNVRKAVTSAYKAIRPKLQAAHSGFKNLVHDALRDHPHAKFKSGLKPLASVHDKVMKRGKKMSQITDFSRGMVILPHDHDVKHFVHHMKKTHGARIEEYEHKSKGTDHTFGYHGTHHFLINHGGVTHELQVMSKKTAAYKKEAHKVYSKYRGDVEHLPAGEQHRSKKLFALGAKDHGHSKAVRNLNNHQRSRLSEEELILLDLLDENDLTWQNYYLDENGFIE